MARALRLQAGLPLSFWGDCVITSVYLINRLPSAVIQNLTPYEKLFKRKPTYHHIRTFGCLAFASNPIKDKDKFMSRGVPCLFLSYPNYKKGYKVLDLTINQTFVSRDVKFVENVFPYNKHNTTQYLNPLPTFMPNPNTHTYTDCDLTTDKDLENEPEAPQNEPIYPEPPPATEPIPLMKMIPLMLLLHHLHHL